MKNKSYRFIILTIVAVLLMALPALSLADYLDFAIEGAQSGATISYAGSTNPLIGTNIHVSSVASYKDDGETQTKLLQITNGILSFTSGNNINVSTDNNWLFGSGGNIKITGDYTINGTTYSGVMMTGSFSSLSADVVSVVDTATKFKILAASFIDTKDTELQKYFGLFSSTWEGALNLQFSVASKNIHAPGPFTSASVLSGDVSNTPVPIPAAFVLFGSGLFGLVCIRRRQI